MKDNSNRFFVFAGSDYYPEGGWHDFVGSFPSKDVAITAALFSKRDWWHVVDIESGMMVNSNTYFTDKQS